MVTSITHVAATQIFRLDLSTNHSSVKFVNNRRKRRWMDGSIDRSSTPSFHLSYMASNHVRPIRTVHLENPTDRLADCPTGSRFMSK